MLSLLPQVPWNASPGLYTRTDGSLVYLNGREDFWITISTDMLDEQGNSKAEMSMECLVENSGIPNGEDASQEEQDEIKKDK